MSNFDKFYDANKTDIKLNSNYFGIIKKEYPRWIGWKIINEYKLKGIDVKNIPLKKIEIFVKNLYYIIYLDQHFI